MEWPRRFDEGVGRENGELGRAGAEGAGMGWGGEGGGAQGGMLLLE